MKIKCDCDNIIPDQTDYLSYKAYVIGDKDWFNFFDAIDEELLNAAQTSKWEISVNKIRKKEPSRTAYECKNCGALYFYDSENKLKKYMPSNNIYNGIFDR